MKSHRKQYSSHSSWTFYLIAICTLLRLSTSDCPISYYPHSTLIGSISAKIEDESAIVEQNFQYSLKSALKTHSTNVAIVIHNIEYSLQNEIHFQICHMPSPSKTRLNFHLQLSQNHQNRWQVLDFQFMASQNPIFQMGSTLIEQFHPTKQSHEKQVDIALPLSNTFRQPVIKLFLNGMSISSEISKGEIEQIQNQIEAYKSYSWSASVVTFLTKKLAEREMIHLELSNSALVNRKLQFDLTIGPKNRLSFLRLSYVIFDKNQQHDQNLYVEGAYSQIQSAEHSFEGLENMEMFLLGVQGFKLKQWERQAYSSQPSFYGQQQTFSTKDILSSDSAAVYISYFAIQKQQSRLCDNCADAETIYQQYCVKQCPSGHIRVQERSEGSDAHYCRQCPIRSYLIPNRQGTECVCSMQYYQRQKGNFSQTQSQNLSLKSHPQCLPCNYRCLTCESEYECLTCESNRYKTQRKLNPETKSCECQLGFFDNQENRNIKCEKCHDTCETCSGKSQFQCETCPVGRVLHQNGNCVCEGNFQYKNGNCLCEPPKFSYKGYCFSFLTRDECGDNEIQATAPNGTNYCRCKPLFHRFKEICVECRENEVLNVRNGLCECAPDAFEAQDSTCKLCKDGQIYDSGSSSCICKEGLHLNSKGKCIICKKREALIDDHCECIYNYFRNSWGQCERCRAESQSQECQVNKF